MRVQGKKIMAVGMTNEELLIKAGYSLMPDGGFTRKFDVDYRFHCYVIRDGVHKGKIEIHTDKNKIAAAGYRFHIASRFMTTDERKRIKSFLPKPPEQTGKKGKRLKSVILPRSEYLKAMAELRRERDMM